MIEVNQIYNIIWIKTAQRYKIENLLKTFEKYDLLKIQLFCAITDWNSFKANNIEQTTLKIQQQSKNIALIN